MAVCAGSAELASWAVGLASWRHRIAVMMAYFQRTALEPPAETRARNHAISNERKLGGESALTAEIIIDVSISGFER